MDEIKEDTINAALTISILEQRLLLQNRPSSCGERLYDTRFDMMDLPCVDTHLFRFTTEEIGTLRSHFRIPLTLITSSRARFDGDEAVAITLRRFAYPCWWADLAIIFHRPVSHLCEAFYSVCDHIYDHFCHLLDFDISSISYKFPEFAAKVHWKGGALETCVGFLDGTFRPICRPTMNQKVCFSGHKRAHGLTF